jgi:hypothetical protein
MPSDEIEGESRENCPRRRLQLKQDPTPATREVLAYDGPFKVCDMRVIHSVSRSQSIRITSFGPQVQGSFFPVVPIIVPLYAPLAIRDHRTETMSKGDQISRGNLRFGNGVRTPFCNGCQRSQDRPPYVR